jgi:sugar phosphate isomerase/epimerase
MKLGCSSSSYRAAFAAGRMDLREWLRECAEEMEVDGVEIAYEHAVVADPAYLREIKRICVDRQLTICAVSVENDFGRDDERTLEIEKVRRACDVAAVLGAPLVTVLGSSLPANRNAREQGRIVGLLRKVFGDRQPNARALWSEMTFALRQCADHAGERGVAVALQNSQSRGLASDLWQLERCLHDAGASWLRVSLDPAELADRRGIDRLLERTVHVRARLRDIADDGSDRAVRWPEVVRALQLGRYRGYLTIDYGGADPEVAVPRAARYLRGVMQLLGRQQLLTPPVAASPNGHGEAAAVVEEAARAGVPAALSRR